MPKDGVVYAKWGMDSDDYESAKWIKTLDLSKCNTWTYTKS